MHVDGLLGACMHMHGAARIGMGAVKDSPTGDFGGHHETLLTRVTDREAEALLVHRLHRAFMLVRTTGSGTGSHRSTTIMARYSTFPHPHDCCVSINRASCCLSMARGGARI